MKLPDTVEQKLPEGAALRQSLESGKAEDALKQVVYLKLDLPSYPDEYFRKPLPAVTEKKSSFTLFSRPKPPEAPAEHHDDRLIGRMMERRQVRDPICAALKKIIQADISYPADTDSITLQDVTVGQIVEALAIPGIKTASYDYRDLDVARVRTPPAPIGR